MFRFGWIPASVVLVVSLACSTTGANTEIRDTAQDFYRALAVDPPRAYTYLSDDCQDELHFLEFASSAALFASLLGESEPSVENLRVLRSEGDEVEAEFDVVVHVNDETVAIIPAADSGTSRFVKEDGHWRFSSCEFVSFDARAESDLPVEPKDDSPVEEESPLAEAIAAEADDDPSLAGEYVDLPAIYGGPYGNQDGPHTAAHTAAPVNYEAHGNTNPPAGGPHWGSGACGSTPADSPPFCGPVPWGVHRSEWDAESLVHNMEHGGVVIWYNTTDRDVVDELEAIVGDRLSRRDLIVMAPYLEMEDETIALTGWSRIEKFPANEYTAERVNAFFDDHVRRFNPEEF